MSGMPFCEHWRCCTRCTLATLVGQSLLMEFGKRPKQFWHRPEPYPIEADRPGPCTVGCLCRRELRSGQNRNRDSRIFRSTAEKMRSTEPAIATAKRGRISARLPLPEPGRAKTRFGFLRWPAGMRPTEAVQMRPGARSRLFWPRIRRSGRRSARRRRSPASCPAPHRPRHDPTRRPWSTRGCRGRC